jgi:serine/threonine protein kinase
MLDARATNHTQDASNQSDALVAATEPKDELGLFLDALDALEEYEVIKTLAKTNIETTEVVRKSNELEQIDDGSTEQLFIRKIIHLDACIQSSRTSVGLGIAYERIFTAQQHGRTFAHLPQIYNYCKAGDDVVVVMEYLRGATLAQSMAYGHGEPWMFAAICDAVTELHEAFNPPVIHRDLKPQNIILNDGCAWLIDLSIAREFKPDATADTMYFGTREYSPPEQFGFGQTDVRSDVYALGKLMAYCTFGDAAIQDVEGIAATPSGKPIANPPFDPDMEAVYNKACALDPNQRFKSAAELKSAYLGALQNACEQKIANTQRKKAAFQSASTMQCEPCANNSAYNQSALRTKTVDVTPVQRNTTRLITANDHSKKSTSFASMYTHAVKTVNRHKSLQVVCWIWDGWLLIIALMILLVTGICIFAPGDTPDAEMSVLYRFVEYGGMLCIPCLAVLYAASWRGPIRRILPKAKIMSRPKAIVFAICCFLAVFVVLIIYRSLAGY